MVLQLSTQVATNAAARVRRVSQFVEAACMDNVHDVLVHRQFTVNMTPRSRTLSKGVINWSLTFIVVSPCFGPWQ